MVCIPGIPGLRDPSGLAARNSRSSIGSENSDFVLRETQQDGLSQSFTGGLRRRVPDDSVSYSRLEKHCHARKAGGRRPNAGRDLTKHWRQAWVISGRRLREAGTVVGAGVGRTSRAASARKYDVVRCSKGGRFCCSRSRPRNRD